jgi:predicted DNA-binding transcriptional regulator AlpA
MKRTLTSRIAQERVAGRCLSTRTPEPPTVDAVTVTEGTSIAGTSVERLLTVGEAATFLRVSTSFLAKRRMSGDGPPFVVIGRRGIRYAESALLQWTSANTHQSTSERDQFVRRFRRSGRSVRSQTRE